MNPVSNRPAGYNGLQGLDVSDLPYDIALMVLIMTETRSQNAIDSTARDQGISGYKHREGVHLTLGLHIDPSNVEGGRFGTLQSSSHYRSSHMQGSAVRSGDKKWYKIRCLGSR